MKLLVVREHFYHGKVRHEETTSYVYEIRQTEDIGFGLARLTNVDGCPVFEMTANYSGLIQVAGSLTVAHIILNGEVIEEPLKQSFGFGDVLQVNHTYVGDSLVSRDTIVLVPDLVPTRYRA